MKRQKVLFVGWDAADWKVIDSLIAQGKLPFLKSFLETAVRADISTLYPAFSPMLWTSIATGKRPYKHGILGFSEPTPDGQSIRPITNLSRKTKALWNILSQTGATSHVIGWWPSNPAEPINGSMISNHYQRCTVAPGKEWPITPGTVHPPELAASLAELRLRPQELLPEQIFHFMPHADTIDQARDGRFASCCSVIADSFNIHAACTWLMENREWDMMAVYYDAIDHFGHGFMKYHPPQQEFVSDRDFDHYHNVITAGYELHALYLQRLMELAGDDVLVILMSDHGFHPDHLRPSWLPNEPAGPATEHREFGIFAMRGPGIRKGVEIGGCNLLDVVPTILTALGLPVGEDMDGRPLLEAFETPPVVTTVPSWDDVPGPAGMHPADLRQDGYDSQEALNQLVALGYIDAPDADREVAVRKTRDELQYNLACSYMDGGRHADARPVLEDLAKRHPDQFRYATQLAFCQQMLGDLRGMRRSVDGLLAQRYREATKARETIHTLQNRLQIAREDAILAFEDEGDAFLRRPEWSFAALMKPADEATAKQSLTDAQKEELAKQRAQQEQRFRALDGYQRIDAIIGQTVLSRQEQQDMQTAQGLTAVSEYPLEFLAATLCIAEGDSVRALKHLDRAARFEPDRPQLHIQYGETHLIAKDHPAALASFNRVLAVEPENAFAHYGIGRIHAAAGRHQDAAQCALAAIRLKYAIPQFHHFLGESLLAMGRPAAAVKAIGVALSLNPFFPAAHDLLAKVHTALGDTAAAASHAAEAARQRTLKPEPSEAPAAAAKPAVWIDDELIARGREAAAPAAINGDGVITIVSGLPRSGTSMMMQMLTAAGIPPLTDGQRIADIDNPEGYWELERVKNLANDKGWVPEARDRSVKVIAQLLPSLPDAFRYRIVFMNRSISEVLRSQRKMLEHSGQIGASIDDEQLRLSFDRQLRQVLRWAADQPNVSLLVVNHRDAITDPAATAARVATFLGGHLDQAAMTGTVKTELHRQK